MSSFCWPSKKDYKDKDLSIELNSAFKYLLKCPIFKNGGVNYSKIELFIKGLMENMDDDFCALVKCVA